MRRRFAPWLSVLAVLVAGSGCALQPNDNTLPGQTAVGSDGYTVKVHFSQIENLVPNSTVQKDNVVIGTVTEIDTKNWEGIVTLRLLRKAELPANAVFSIGQKTLLGAQYVEVTTPDSTDASGEIRTLRDGDVIGADQTGSYPPTEQVLGAVALLLNNGGLSQVSTITGELSTALHGRVPDTRTLVRRTNELLAVLDQNKADVVRTLEALESFSAGLRSDQAELVDAIERITPGLRTLEQERARLVAAVSKTARTSEQAVEIVNVTEDALLANLDALGPILTNLGNASESLPEAMKIALTIPFPAMTTHTVVKGDYANLFSTLDLRSSSLSLLWNGGTSPALQGGDPVNDPLTAQPPGATEAPEATEGLSDKVDELLGGQTLNPDPDDRTGGSGSGDNGCALKLLGVC